MPQDSYGSKTLFSGDSVAEQALVKLASRAGFANGLLASEFSFGGWNLARYPRVALAGKVDGLGKGFE